MNGRRSEIDLTYNGTVVKEKMEEYQLEVTYTDPASEETDTLDINIQDSKRQWTVAWLPIAGDTMTAAIKVFDWDKEGDNRTLPCGFFILDDFNFAGWPITGTISGVSAPADGAFGETERTRTWEKVTIQQIGTEIAARAGISLVWDVADPPFTILSIEQTGKTDCSFLMELCKTYGLAMKVYAQKIVIYDREKYKKKDPVAKITEMDMQSWSWHRGLAGTYTGGEFSYSSPKTEKEIKATVGTGKRVLKISGKADGQTDAERKILAAVNEANHSATTISMTIMGRPDLVASQCVTVVGLGKLSGKYYIDKVTSHIGGGFTMDVELSLVSDMTAEVISDATQRLTAVGVMNTPAYWMAHYKDVTGLDGLILDMATRIKINVGGNSIATVETALTVLAKEGVINAPDYWAEKHTAVAWLDVLLIKAANALTKGSEKHVK